MYLGLDLSTQQLKATLINRKGQIVKEDQVVFDSLGFGTKDGVNVEGAQVTAPPLMWIAALEELLERLSEFLPQVAAISGCGQQHATVYYNQFPDLQHSKSLVEIWKDSFSIKDSPIWQDSSTTEICKEMENLVESAQELANLTGSSAYERFSGSQIAKLARTKPTEFESTTRIGLASSLFPSVFLGKFADLDPSDASGMNLMNIYTKSWHSALVNYCHPKVLEKLGPIGKENEVLGEIHPYFTKRYNISSDCVITTFTGDNPATISSCPLIDGDLVISLGTSDTCTFIISNPNPLADAGHVFCNPNDPKSYMAMLCFRNGSLARQGVRDIYANGNWEIFNAQIKEGRLDPNRIGFYFFDTEIIPKGVKGLFHFKDEKLVPPDDINVCHSRLIIESQALIQYHYTSVLGLKPKRIICQGGGSKNIEILRIISNVFGAPVFTLKADNGASLGGCFRAMYALQGDNTTYAEFLETIYPGFNLAAEPDLESFRVYRQINIQNLLFKISTSSIT